MKGLAIYNVPTIDLQLSGTFRSLPYPGNEFPSIQSQSLGGTYLDFGAFGSGNQFEFLNIVKPGALYGNRLNAMDLRFSKIVPGIISKEGKTHLNFDLYNLFNSNTTEVFQRNYSAPSSSLPSTYLDPLQIMSARYFKFGTKIDF